MSGVLKLNELPEKKVYNVNGIKVLLLIVAQPYAKSRRRDDRLRRWRDTTFTLVPGNATTISLIRATLITRELAIWQFEPRGFLLVRKFKDIINIWRLRCIQRRSIITWAWHWLSYS